MDYKTLVLDLIKKIYAHMEWDFDKDFSESDGKGLSLKGLKAIQDHFHKKELLHCVELINTGKSELALAHLYDVSDNFMPQFRYTEETLMSDRVEKDFATIETLRAIVRLYQYWFKNDYEKIVNSYNNPIFFEADEANTEKISPNIYIAITEAIKKNLFKSYVYKGGDDIINPKDKFIIYPKLGISESIEEWFRFLQSQTSFTSSLKQDEVVATYFLKLDEVDPHFCNFIISIHKGSSIYVVSDAIHFNNPKQKSMRRNPNRYKESHYENIGLPYGLAWELDEIRKESTSIVTSAHIEKHIIKLSGVPTPPSRRDDAKSIKQKYYDTLAEKVADEVSKFGFENIICTIDTIDFFERDFTFKCRSNGKQVAYYETKNSTLTIFRTPEFLFKDIKSLQTVEKMYMIGLVENLIENLSFNPPSTRVMLAHEFIEQKLLEGEKIDRSDNNFEHYTKAVEERVSEILDSIDHKETALMLRDYSVVRQSHHYDRNWLATPEDHKKLSKWYSNETQRLEIQKKLNQLELNSKVDHELLHGMLWNNFENIVSIVLSASEVKMLMLDKNNMDHSVKPNRYHFSNLKDYSKEKAKVDDYRRFGELPMGIALKYTPEKQKCQCCGKYDTLLQATVKINSYEQLMLLTCVKDRKELPAYYRSYKSHSLEPYHGNSILSDVNPYALLKDPCSDRFPNGINMGIFMCNKCRKEKIKHYYKSDYVLLDLSGSIVSTDPNDKSYKENYSFRI